MTKRVHAGVVSILETVEERRERGAQKSHSKIFRMRFRERGGSGAS